MARYRSRGYRRQVRRKFVWNRVWGTLSPTNQATSITGVDLLQDFRNTPGASTVGSTVMRIRGLLVPTGIDTVPNAASTFGFLIDSANEDPASGSNMPVNRPEEDWLGWLPWNANLGTVPSEPGTWNSAASPWAVDIKAARKLEEVGQTLWMFMDRPTQGTYNVYYNLSIGLKLP